MKLITAYGDATASGGRNGDEELQSVELNAHTCYMLGKQVDEEGDGE